MAKDLQDLIAEARAEIPEVQPQEVKEMLDSGAHFFLIDVRDAEELAQGKLPGAIHASRGRIEMQIGGLCPDPGAKVVLYCQGGVRSLFAAQRLRQLGYENVSSMAGGFGAWESGGLPLG